MKEHWTRMLSRLPPHTQDRVNAQRNRELRSRVMVGIPANIFQVIVLATSTNAFLGIRCALQGGHVATRIHGSHEDGLELRDRRTNIQVKHGRHTQDACRHTPQIHAERMTLSCGVCFGQNEF